MSNCGDDKLTGIIRKHLEIAKNTMLNADIREESRQLAQFLVELVGFRKFYGKLKKETEKGRK